MPLRGNYQAPGMSYNMCCKLNGCKKQKLDFSQVLRFLWKNKPCWPGCLERLLPHLEGSKYLKRSVWNLSKRIQRLEMY